MTALEMKTIYTSNIPLDCHILKGRLETEGVSCFIYDENIVWVDPFSAVAVGGVKLKVPIDSYSFCQDIIKKVSDGKLFDENGDYDLSKVLNDEIKKHNEILFIKSKIRAGSLLLDETAFDKTSFISHSEIPEIIRNEKKYRELSKKKFKFSWKQFYYELFDFERSVIKYFRTKPAEYYIEKELVENFIKTKETNQIAICPFCKSENTAFGVAIDSKWEIVYFLLSILLAPLFPLRSNYHCFDCSNDFKITKNK